MFVKHIRRNETLYRIDNIVQQSLSYKVVFYHNGYFPHCYRIFDWSYILLLFVAKGRYLQGRDYGTASGFIDRANQSGNAACRVDAFAFIVFATEVKNLLCHAMTFRQDPQIVQRQIGSSELAF